MSNLKTTVIAAILFIASNMLTAQSQHPEYKADYQAVNVAILDYVEGIYLVDSSRIARSVHPELRKRGYWFDKKNKAYNDNLDMTYTQLKNLAASWNKDGKNANNQTVKIIEIFDVNDRTATAKLTAAWGIDYFHLAKLDGKWQIMNVLWQSIKE